MGEKETELEAEREEYAQLEEENAAWEAENNENWVEGEAGEGSYTEGYEPHELHELS
jgi:hypothetical protein